MSDIHFEWNQAKANFLKHKVSFDEAKTVFLDENANIIADPDHSKDEDRFVILGLMEKIDMRKEYDFSAAKKNPYAKKLKKQVTIRLDEETITYFKDMAEDKEIPYQTLINLYLRDCAMKHKNLQINWK